MFEDVDIALIQAGDVRSLELVAESLGIEIILKDRKPGDRPQYKMLLRQAFEKRGVKITRVVLI